MGGFFVLLPVCVRITTPNGNATRSLRSGRDLLPGARYPWMDRLVCESPLLTQT